MNENQLVNNNNNNNNQEVVRSQPSHIDIDDEIFEKKYVQPLRAIPAGHNSRGFCGACIEALFCCNLCASCFNNWMNMKCTLALIVST